MDADSQAIALIGEDRFGRLDKAVQWQIVRLIQRCETAEAELALARAKLYGIEHGAASNTAFYAPPAC